MGHITSTYTIDVSQANKELEKIEKRARRIHKLLDELSAAMTPKPKRGRKPKA